jgi:hypothetical protein
MSNYHSFDLKFRGDAGEPVPLPNVTIKVFDATNLEDLPDLETDENGIVAGGTLDVPVGTVVRFRVEHHLGMARHVTQVTT